MLRTWLVRISPLKGNPAGNTMLVPKGRTREVIGQTIANSVTRQNSAGETTSAGALLATDAGIEIGPDEIARLGHVRPCLTR